MTQSACNSTSILHRYRTTLYYFSRAHNGVSIASAGKASIVLAKSYVSFHSTQHLPSWSIVETTYFTLLFLIRSINAPYLERNNTRYPALALRILFMATLYRWFNTASNSLFLVLIYVAEGLSGAFAVELLRSPFYLCVLPYILIFFSIVMYLLEIYRLRKTGVGLTFPEVNLNRRYTWPCHLPRRVRRLCTSRDPPAIHCYSTTFLSVTRRLLSSKSELARGVQEDASPFGRFISLSGLASGQPELMNRTEERLRPLLDQARQVRVRRSDLTTDFLDNRDDPHYREDDLGRWWKYQGIRERRHSMVQLRLGLVYAENSEATLPSAECRLPANKVKRGSRQ